MRLGYTSAVKLIVRMTMKKLLVVILLWCAAQHGALACSCARMLTISEAAQKADGIAIGRAYRVINDNEAYIQETHFKLKKVWKGKFGPQLLTRMNSLCCTCEYFFEEGRTYLLYLYKQKDGYYVTYECTRTMTLDRAAADIKELDRLHPNNALERTGDK